MTAKRELEELARRAFGGAFRHVHVPEYTAAYAYAGDFGVSVSAPTCDERREMLADALRGIIEGKQRRAEK